MIQDAELRGRVASLSWRDRAVWMYNNKRLIIIRSQDWNDSELLGMYRVEDWFGKDSAFGWSAVSRMNLGLGSGAREFAESLMYTPKYINDTHRAVDAMCEMGYPLVKSASENEMKRMMAKARQASALSVDWKSYGNSSYSKTTTPQVFYKVRWR